MAELTAVAAGYEPEHIGPVIRPLYEELCKRLDAAGVTPTGPGIAYYEACADAAPGSGADEGAITVHAAIAVSAEPAPGQDFAIVDLPAVEQAATIVHRGPMDEVVPTGQALARWIDESGRQSAGYAREVTLEWDEDPRKWVTELQEPLL